MSSSDPVESNENEETSETFPVVGIGASAGGLEALEQFFSRVSQQSAMAYLVLLHSSPEKPNLLPEILQRNTSLPVILAQEVNFLQPNQVYVIPPRNTARIVDRQIQLVPIEDTEVPTSIDRFFRSLAESQQNNAVGIILSGMGSDGTLGAQAIKSQEGLVLVQSEETAVYYEMPYRVVLAGAADQRLSPEEMPQAIAQYFQGKPILPTETEVSEELLREIFAVLHSRIGHDFSAYKRNTLLRRINRRMNLQQIEEYSQYLEFLRNQPQEINILFREFLIGVTKFFREAAAFEILKQNLLPPLLNSLPDNGTFRVWVPGCSSGEEVYSLAMILIEAKEQISKRINLQLFGTDIDKLAIDRAREGLFPASIADDVTQQRLKRFFTVEGEFYRVGRELRYCAVFSVQNVLRDPPFSRLHLLSCRNLLIYLQEETQKRLLPLFHYTLNHSGILILGSSESINGFQNLFHPLSKKWKIFQRREVSRSQLQPIRFPTGSSLYPTTTASRSSRTNQETSSENSWEKTIQKRVQQFLIKEFCPVAILIESNGLIHYVEGRTGKFLETVSGTPSNNIFNLAREGLKAQLELAIQNAITSGETVTREQIPVSQNGDTQMIKLSVHPLETPQELAGYLLVLLETVTPNWSGETEEISGESTPLQEREARIAELEKELQDTRESHQITIEELQSSNEELQVTNEELESSNEELQVTNEELESSKEELQSLNEELKILNEELQTKVDELSAAEEDMNNLLNSTEIAVVFVDQQMQVKRFTPQATALINLIETDIGRPIQQISTNLTKEEVMTDLQQVLDTLQPKAEAVQTREGKWYRMRIFPYRKTDNTIEGAVLTFTDIDEWKKSQEDLQDLQLVLQEVLEVNTAPLVLLNEEKKVMKSNQAFDELIRLDSEESLATLEQALSEQLGSLLDGEEAFSDASFLFPGSDPRSDRYLVSSQKIGRFSNVSQYFLLKIRKPPDEETRTTNP